MEDRKRINENITYVGEGDMREKKRNHYKNKGRIVKGILSFALALAMVSGTLPGRPFVMTARAESAASEKTITGLGTGAITNPVQPANTTDGWKGSYVYYGKYDGTNPTRYRVLDMASDKFGVTGGSLFLDCDSTLYKAAFDNDGIANNGESKPNEWAYSDVKAGLNGGSFLTKTGNFTDVERNAIAGITVKTHPLVQGSEAGQVTEWTANAFKSYTPLTGEQIFLLDAEDASNIAYGYSTADTGVENRKKKDSNGDDSWWWLRSPYSIDYDDCAGKVGDDGGEYNGGAVYYDDGIYSLGVSPAFNVNLSSVIFSSLISSESSIGQPGAEYKLTLKDGGLSVSVAGAVTKDADNKVSIPYTITDSCTCADPTQISVVVTDGTWTENGWSGATTFQYTKLGVDSFDLTGTGTFTLDGSKFSGVWGTDYHVYILAEDVNGDKETDYASTPVEIKALTASAVGYEGAYDGQAHGIAVTITDQTSVTTVMYGDAADNCSSDTSPTITNVSDSPKTVYYQVSADGYLTATGSADIKINKAPLTVKAKDKTITYGETPANDGVEYSGFVNSENESVLGGTLSYDYNYSQGGNAGSYTITPKGLTSDNYAISFETGTLTVKAKSGGGGSSGGGNSGSGGSPSPVTPSEKYTVPVSGENTVEVTAEITNGNAVINEISKSDIDRIIDSRSGSKSGDESIPITIDLSQAKSEVYSVELSGKTMERLTEAVNAENNVESVEIKLTNATVTLDGEALSAINEQAEGRSVTLAVEDTNTGDLNKAQQRSLKQFDSAKPFRAAFESDGKEIHDFKGGSVRVSLSFSPEKDRNARHYHIYYLPKTGAMERLLTYYTKGLLLFVTSHFSDYAIVYDQSIENGDPEDPVNPVDPEDPVNPENPVELIEMHRLYNPNSGEHFYTGDAVEKDHLVELGWNYEGVAWCAPEKSEIPVYRLYNPNAGDHHYTADVKERDFLIKEGWNDEGIGLYSEESETVALFRLYNPNALGAGAHHFTADAAERDHLIEIGWMDEKTGWYGALRMAAGAA